MQMMVKDTKSLTNQNFYKVLLYSFDEGYGERFFNMEPCNLWHEDNSAKLEKIQFYLQAMLRFNVIVEALLERRN